MNTGSRNKSLACVPGLRLKGPPVRNDDRIFAQPARAAATESLPRCCLASRDSRRPVVPAMLLARRDPENDSAPSKRVRGPTGDLALDALVESVVCKGPPIIEQLPIGL
jgi:hypothetical protein